MKIGILTFSAAINYGAVLQAYGLKNVLCQLGHNAGVIDYVPVYFEKEYRICRPSFRSLIHNKGRIHWLRFLLKNTDDHKRIKKFTKFVHDNLNPISLSQINSLDAIIYGSDQIWNPSLCGGSFDELYFGKRVNTQIKKIAYAPSVGNLGNIKDKETEFKNLLHNFDFISAREHNLAQYISKLLSNQIVPAVLDPTLLAGRNAFELLVPDIRIKSDYILYFDFFGDQCSRAKAFKLAQVHNCSVVEPFSFNETGANGCSRFCSPEEFCGLVKNAKIVVTTSFHGAAFAILFNRPFYALEFNQRFNDRILSLLNALEITTHFVYQNADIKESPIDWVKTNNLLERLREESLAFLFNAL